MRATVKSARNRLARFFPSHLRNKKFFSECMTGSRVGVCGYVK